MSRTFIIAEIGINHNGDIALAKKLIDVAKRTGCDAVKFQKETLMKFTLKSFCQNQGESLGQNSIRSKKGLEFSFENYKEIDSYCKKRNYLVCICMGYKKFKLFR